MADDIVQTVKLEGADQTVAGFEKIGAAGAAAMKTVGESASGPNKQFAATVKNIEGLSRKFGESLRDFGSHSQRFVSNVGRMGATVTKYAAMTGLGIAAVKKFSNATQDQSEDVKQAVAANRLNERSQADSALRALDNEKAMRDLTAQFATGKLTITEYSKAVAELQRTQRQEEEFARRAELIRSAENEDRIRQEAQIKKEAAARKAYADAVRSYGSDVASALVQLGPAYDTFLAKLNEGPSVIAEFMRGLALLFNQHGTEIVAIVNQVADAFASLFTDTTTGGSQAQGFADTMITAIRAVGSAITGYLIPTIKTIVGWFNVVASGLNAMFGTQLTGGILALGAAFLVFSGALPAIAAGIAAVVFGFQALNTALQALGSLTPMGVAIRLIIVALVLLWVHWDKVKVVIADVVDTAKKKWQEWADWFKGLINSLNATWTEWRDWVVGLWTSLIEAAKSAATSIGDAFLALIPGLGPVLAFFQKLFKTITDANNAAKDSQAAAGGHEQNRSEFARGGPIGGGGTSTSDSVPIWASRGEWVIRAQAAQFYGRRFMSMVNSMRLPRGMPSLADSLVLPSPKARFAMGGEIGGERGGSRVLNLTLPGLGSFPGLTGPDDTMDRLQVAAVRSQIRSAGRLPGWYGGR